MKNSLIDITYKLSEVLSSLYHLENENYEIQKKYQELVVSLSRKYHNVDIEDEIYNENVEMKKHIMAEIQLLKDKLVDKDTYSIHDHTRYMCSAYLPREFRPNKFPSRYKLEPIRDAFNLYLLKEYHGSKYRQGVDEHEILCS